MHNLQNWRSKMNWMIYTSFTKTHLILELINYNYTRHTQQTVFFKGRTVVMAFHFPGVLLERHHICASEYLCWAPRHIPFTFILLMLLFSLVQVNPKPKSFGTMLTINLPSNHQPPPPSQAFLSRECPRIMKILM